MQPTLETPKALTPARQQVETGLTRLGSEDVPSGLSPGAAREALTPGMGSLTAAILTSVSTIGSTVLPSILGPPEDPRQKALREARRYEAAQSFLESDLNNLEADLSNNLTVDEANDILDSNARAEYTRLKQEYEAVFSDQGVPDATLLATTAAEAGRAVYLSEASNAVLWANMPYLVLGGLGVVGLGYLGYTYLIADDE